MNRLVLSGKVALRSTEQVFGFETMEGSNTSGPGTVCAVLFRGLTDYEGVG